MEYMDSQTNYTIEVKKSEVYTILEALDIYARTSDEPKYAEEIMDFLRNMMKQCG